MKRIVYTNNLPRLGNGKGISIDWKNSVGCECDFEYDDIIGKISIVEYIGSEKIKVKYEDSESVIKTYNFKTGNISSVIGRYNTKYIYKIGDVVGDIIITELITENRYNKNVRAYKYKCLKCGYDCGECYKKGEMYSQSYIYEEDIKNGARCSCCSNKITVPHINSIKAKAPWMIDLGVSEEDAVKYTSNSKYKIEVICPNCEETRYKRIVDVYRCKSISCTCGDGRSYPEKFTYDVLKQLGTNIQIQLSRTTFEWCEGKRYDFYIPEYNMIIETHGEQHYKNTTWSTMEDQRKNDKYKRELALNNGIKHYIELDCRYSKMEHIRESIINSKLSELFDLSKIDWNESDLYALKSNKIKEVCDYWSSKEEWETVRDLENKFGLSNTSIIKYLRIGNKLNICNYDAKYEKFRISSEVGKNRSKSVCMYLNGELIHKSKSIKELIDEAYILFNVKLTKGLVSMVCTGKRNHHKGFIFKFEEGDILP